MNRRIDIPKAYIREAAWQQFYHEPYTEITLSRSETGEERGKIIRQGGGCNGQENFEKLSTGRTESGESQEKNSEIEGNESKI